VYGKHAIGGEEQDLNPISPYGVSKLAAEKLLLAYSNNFGLPVKILRYFSVYGPMQRPDMAFAKLINCIKFGKAFNLYGDGTQKRSNTYVEDIVNATLMAESCSSGQVLNICGDDHVSLNQVIQIIETITNSKIQIVGNDPRNGDQEDTFGDNSKAKSILKWSPKTGIREGLKLQIESVL
jgi:UDP-glucose 4-epimerase